MSKSRVRQLLAMIACGAALSVAQLTTPPVANASGCYRGGTEVGTPWGGYCDEPAFPTGQHWHCQWGMGFSMCGWKWADNTDAPMPQGQLV